MARVLLNHIDDALLLITRSGRLASEHSRVAEAMLGKVEPGMPVWRLFEVENPRYSAWLESCWISAEDGWMPLDLALSQLPSTVALGDRVLNISVRMADPADPDSAVVLVARDETEAMRSREAEQVSHEVARLLMRNTEEPHLVASFLAESGRLVGGVCEGRWPAADQRRAVHTLKGSALVMGLDALGASLHNIEERMAGEETGTCSEPDRAVLRRRWDAIAGPLVSLLERDATHELRIQPAEVASIVALVEARRPRAELLAALHNLTWEPVRARLELLAQRVGSMDEANGVSIQAHVSCDELRAPPTAAWSSLWSNLVHLVRNAVVHGFETPAERAAAGKPADGQLALRAWQEAGRFIVEVSDDGRGVSWAHVARKAQALGLPCSDRSDLVAALFADGLTTQDRATLLSGRGVGLSSVWHAAHRLGGTVDLQSEEGRGTTVRIVVPLSTPPSFTRAPIGPADQSEGAIPCP